jgi:hypothetical protein
MDHYTITGLTDLLGVSRSTLHRWVDRGLLTPRNHLGFGRRKRVSRRDVLHLLLADGNREMLGRLGWRPSCLLVGLPPSQAQMLREVTAGLEVHLAADVREAGMALDRHEPVSVLADLRDHPTTRLALLSACRRERPWLALSAVTPDDQGDVYWAATGLCQSVFAGGVGPADLRRAILGANP